MAQADNLRHKKPTVTSASVPHAHAIAQRRLAIFRDGNVELGRKRGGLLRFKTRRNHFPIPTDWLVHNHVYRGVFVIANLDFVSVLVHVTRDDFVIGLLAFRDYVKSVADFHAHVLVLGRVINLVFTDELLIAGRVLLVEPNRAGRQGHAELVLLRVSKLHEHANLLFDWLTGVVVVLVIVTLATEYELFLHVEPGGLKQRHLLGLVVTNRRRALQRVQVILKEALLLELRLTLGLSSGHADRHVIGTFLRHTIDVTGDRSEEHT